MSEYSGTTVLTSTISIDTTSETPSVIVKYSAPTEPRQASGNARNGIDALPPTLANADPPAPAAARSAVPMPATALDAALTIMDAWTVAGIAPRLVPIWVDGSTRVWSKADQTRDDILRNRADWRRAVGVGAVDCGLIDIDVDAPDAELVAANLAGDVRTFEIQSRRGRHRVYLRGDVAPADYRAGHVYDAQHPAEALAPKLDAGFGLVRVWMPGKSWLTDPASIAPMPARLRDAVAGIVQARQLRHDAEAATIAQRAAEAERQRQARPQTAERDLRPYADATLAGISRDGAALSDGQRGEILFKLACRAGKLVGAAFSGMNYADAEAAMMDAADRCGYVQSNGPRSALAHIRRGILRGMADPMPEPADRDLVRASLPPDRLREIERRAAAAANDVLPRAKTAGIHPARAEVIRRLTDELAQRCVDQGRVEVAASVADLALQIDASPATVWRAAQAMPALGWTIQTGKLGADGRAMSTVWRLPLAQNPVAAAYPQDETWLTEGAVTYRPCSGNRSAHKRFILRISRPSAIVRGLRRKLPGLACALRPAGKRSDGRRNAELARLDATLIELDPPAAAPLPADRGTIDAAHFQEIGSLPGCGTAIYRLLPALAEVAESMTVAELAVRTGCSNDSTRRGCAILAERGLALVGTVRTAGRSAKDYILTAEARAAVAGEHVADPSPILAATIEVGAMSIRRAQARIDAERLLLADARTLAERLQVGIQAAIAGIRSQIRRMAAAERDADLSMPHSPIVADARRKVRRDRMTEVQQRIARERQAAVWSMGAQAVPSW